MLSSGTHIYPTIPCLLRIQRKYNTLPQRQLVMIVPTFITLAALIISLFTLANAIPVPAKRALTEPRSLLGRQYRHVRVLLPPTSAYEHLPPRTVEILAANQAPISRADRFHTIYRRLAEMVGRGDRVPVHNQNLLSNQSLGAPPVLTLPTPTPSSTQPEAPSASATALPPAAVHVKHSKGKKIGKRPNRTHS